ncbi:hypothetical protein V6Z11_A11G195200 [Gossypium hirsutum]
MFFYICHARRPKRLFHSTSSNDSPCLFGKLFANHSCKLPEKNPLCFSIRITCSQTSLALTQSQIACKVSSDSIPHSVQDPPSPIPLIILSTFVNSLCFSTSQIKNLTLWGS